MPLDFEIFERATAATLSSSPSSFAGEGLLVPIPFDDKEGWLKELKKISAPWQPAALKRVETVKFKCKKRGVLFFDHGDSQRIVLAFWRKGTAFETLAWARSCVQAFKGSRAKSIGLELSHLQTSGPWLEALVSAFTVARYQQPRYKKKPPPPATKQLSVLSKQQEHQTIAQSAFAWARATNGIRFLTETAGNDLTPSALKELALSFRELPHIKTQFFGKKELEKMGAGAFLAVVRGTEEPGVGIVQLSYKPKGAQKKVALVGKGVTFDTGGNNLKTGGHMLGMNGDMGGSATVLALLWLASTLHWKIEMEGFVTIAENVIGPSAYRPNDVVSALNGKTIEVIDTDAEGRMLLADALSLAAQEKPSVMIDFATLTGACIRAIGTNYSGVFTNQAKFLPQLIRAGKNSGERVWPFPLDADYGQCLKSRIADIKQCRPSGGSDHIEAAYFLSQFVARVPWVHVDLSASENAGGLAHVPTKTTGFGVRFTREFLQESLDLKLS